MRCNKCSEHKMNKRLSKEIVTLTKKLYKIPCGKNKHISFLVHRNDILSIGWNDYLAVDPFCRLMGYKYSQKHSEVSALLRFRGNRSIIKECNIVNTRINIFKDLGMAKPCILCQKFMNRIGIRKVWYTDQNGEFQRFI